MIDYGSPFRPIKLLSCRFSGNTNSAVSHRAGGKSGLRFQLLQINTSKKRTVHQIRNIFRPDNMRINPIWTGIRRIPGIHHNSTILERSFRPFGNSEPNS